MNADDLYHTLVGRAWKLAKNCMLDVEDIQQDLYLKCMDVADGRSNYTASIGTVENYIMGWLWKDTIKWQKMQSLDANGEKDVDAGSEIARFFPELQSASIEDDLMRRDEMYAQFERDKAEVRRMRDQMKDDSTLLVLIRTGYWSIREVAKLSGINRRKINRMLNHTSNQKAPPRTIDV